MRREYEPIDPPSRALLALEGRAPFELMALLPSFPWLARMPLGDGHPVLVFPGLLASDLSTVPLRRFLQNRGYAAYGWGLGRNVGPTPALSVGLERRLAEVRDRHGRRLSLIGWSLGGVYARELAHRFPADVRQVITLASPFRDVSATHASRLFPLRPGGQALREARSLRAYLGRPLPVPITSIYSRSDGIVAWKSCLEEEGPYSENIEVRSSHFGMGHHPRVLRVIAERLAQPEGCWRSLGRSGR